MAPSAMLCRGREEGVALMQGGVAGHPILLPDFLAFWVHGCLHCRAEPGLSQWCLPSPTALLIQALAA